MRIIKFRVFTIDEGMVYNKDVDCFMSIDSDGTLNSSGFPKHHVMQFTGLKDKKGEEIFEGDILKTSTDKAMVVFWSERFASWGLNRDGWYFTHWFGESCNPKDCEIIGNKYENPELLQDVI
jgi:uncharacterized phage protein (TIGR01671 family)